jgi:hypothetical protein
MNHLAPRALRAFGLIAVCFAFACGDDDYYEDDVYAVPYAYADDAYVISDVEAAYGYAYTDPFYDPFYYDDFDDVYYQTDEAEAWSGDPEQAAMLVEDNADNYFAPIGCAEVTRDGASLTYELDECTGPLGARAISGSVFVTFSRPDSEDDDSEGDDSEEILGIEVTSEDLRTNDRELTLSFEGTFSRDGDMGKRLDLHSMTAVSGDDVEITRDMQSTLTWERGSQCVTVDGSGTQTVNERTLDVEIEEYTRCARECPMAGRVTVEDESGSLDLEFDGSDRAQLETGDGTESEIALTCE